jgi:hypothetical protein
MIDDDDASACVVRTDDAKRTRWGFRETDGDDERFG